MSTPAEDSAEIPFKDGENDPSQGALDEKSSMKAQHHRGTTASYYSFPDSTHEPRSTPSKIVTRSHWILLICCLIGLPIIVGLSYLLSTISPAQGELPVFLYSDDQLVGSLDGQWLTHLDTTGNDSVVAYQFVGSVPPFASTLKAINFLDVSLRVGSSKNESFQYLLYSGSTINAVWNYPLLSGITVTLLRGVPEFETFMNGDSYIPEMETTSNQDELYYTVNNDDYYFVVIWSTALLTSPGTFNLLVQSAVFDTDNATSFCSGNCSFTLDHQKTNYFLLVAPSRGANVQEVDMYEVMMTETPFTAKIVGISVVLAFFAIKLIFLAIWYCSMHSSKLREMKAKAFGYHQTA